MGQKQKQTKKRVPSIADLRKLDDLKMPKFDKDNSKVYYGDDDVQENGIGEDGRFHLGNDPSIHGQIERAQAENPEAVERRRAAFHSTLSPEEREEAPITRWKGPGGAVPVLGGGSGGRRTNEILLKDRNALLGDKAETLRGFRAFQGLYTQSGDKPAVMSGANRADTRKVLAELMAQGMPEEDAAAAIVKDLDVDTLEESAWPLPKHRWYGSVPEKDWDEYGKKAGDRILKDRKKDTKRGK